MLENYLEVANIVVEESEEISDKDYPVVVESN